jgi:phosphoribosyl-AMP cyclohydrolase
MEIVEGLTEAVTEATLDDVAFDGRGLVAAIVQNVEDGEVRMVGYMNREALARTLDSGQVWFWSRSRQAFWRKGETSGNTLETVEVLVDCDGDALLVRARPVGPTCHTGARTCFFRRVAGSGVAQLRGED